MSSEKLKNYLEELTKDMFQLAGALPLQILIRTKKGLLARFTNNGVHQNGFQNLFTYTLRLNGKNGFVQLESNDDSRSGIQAALSSLKKLVPHPTPLSPLKKTDGPKIKEHFPFFLEKVPQLVADTIQKGLSPIRSERASANGYFSAYERSFYFADAGGLRLFHPATSFRFGVTVNKGAGKGYNSFYHPDFRKLNVASVISEASHLAKETSLCEVSLEPGEYECVFSPRAFIELIESLRPHFSHRLYQEGKSVFSGKLGKQIFSESFTLHDDVTHAGQFGIPFDMQGAPRKKVALIENGVLKGLLREGHNTQGVLDHSFYPQNLVASGGERPLSEILKHVRKGIFVNKLRYHTLVRESDMTVSGFATAGSFYIEDGKIKGRVGHLRYHDSLFSVLGSVVGQSSERVLLKDGEMGAALLPYFWISKIRVV